MNKSRGFTIIELLVVLAVMGVFTAIAYPNIMSWITDREVKKEVYETVAFIKERKAEVTSGKYGMTQLHLKPNLEVYTMSPENFLQGVVEPSIGDDGLIIDDLIKERNLAKKNKDYEEADRIRKLLLENDILLEDTAEGTIWRQK